MIWDVAGPIEAGNGAAVDALYDGIKARGVVSENVHHALDVSAARPQDMKSTASGVADVAGQH